MNYEDYISNYEETSTPLIALPFGRVTGTKLGTCWAIMSDSDKRTTIACMSEDHELRGLSSLKKAWKPLERKLTWKPFQAVRDHELITKVHNRGEPFTVSSLVKTFSHKGSAQRFIDTSCGLGFKDVIPVTGF